MDLLDAPLSSSPGGGVAAKSKGVNFEEKDKDLEKSFDKTMATKETKS